MEEIVCVLDRSGSMERTAKDACIGFNRFVREQVGVRDARLTVVWFDNTWEVAYEGMLSGFRPLGRWPVNHWGMTALIDAVGKTIRHVGNRFSREHPEKVILAILTDGKENVSSEFATEEVADLIREHREKYAWGVVFLGADQDSWSVARKLNISKECTKDYASERTQEGFATYSSTVRMLRK